MESFHKSCLLKAEAGICCLNGAILKKKSFNYVQLLTLANDQLRAQFFLIHLLQSSTVTCFEQYLAHPQEVKLYLYSIWYRHSQ
jgi:hypothetical protein